MQTIIVIKILYNVKNLDDESICKRDWKFTDYVYNLLFIAKKNKKTKKKKKKERKKKKKNNNNNKKKKTNQYGMCK